jgi:hypothetical protein
MEKKSWPILMYFPSILLDRLWKATKLRQDSRSMDQDSNSGDPEYETHLLIIRPLCS